MSTVRAIPAPDAKSSSPVRLLMMFAVALFGLAVSVFLTYEYFQSAGIPCTDVGCDTVRIWHNDHFPKGLLPMLGSLYFLALAGLTWMLAGADGSRGRTVATGSMALGAVGTLVMLGLISLEMFKIHAFCMWCLLVAASAVLYFILSIPEWRAWQTGRAGYKLDFEPFLKWGAIPLVVVVLLASGLGPKEDTAVPTVNGGGNKPDAPAPAPQLDPKLLIRPYSHSKGPANAKVTITEFADPGCPACAEEADVVDKLLKKYPKDVRLVYRNFPLKSHEHSKLSAEALEAAAAQDPQKYWQLRTILFHNLSAQTEADLYKYAQKVGLDMTRFKQDFTSHKYAAQVQQDRSDGEALNVNRTPTLFFNGAQRYDGPLTLELLDATVKSLMAAK